MMRNKIRKKIRNKVRVEQATKATKMGGGGGVQFYSLPWIVRLYHHRQ
ncbi:MAG: hypothetical protein ACI90V_013592, partial [Bacillariaceae sp.]